MAMNTQAVITGLRSGAIALEALNKHTADYLNQMADLGASSEYSKLRAGHVRIVELHLSLVNLYTLLESHGASGLWSPQSRGVPRG